MKKHELERVIMGYDLPSEVCSAFDDLVRKIDSYFKNPEIHTPYAFLDSFKQSELFNTIVNTREFLPLIRREYVLSLKRSVDRGIPHYVWEPIIEQMTGGKLKFPEEIPAISSDKSKRLIAGLNLNAQPEQIKKRDMSTVRTGYDIMCGYVLRIDSALNENTLAHLLRFNVL